MILDFKLVKYNCCYYYTFHFPSFSLYSEVMTKFKELGNKNYTICGELFVTNFNLLNRWKIKFNKIDLKQYGGF